MLFLVLAAYSLFALPVRVTLNVRLHALHRETSVEIRAAGVSHTFIIAEKDNKRKQSRKRRGRAVLDAVRRAARGCSVEVFARVGTGDACSSALAAGGVKAALFSGIAALGEVRAARVCVAPDFSQRVFALSLRCIFSVNAGDTILSLVRQKLGRKRIMKQRKEGTRWSSIPLRT
ncbi:MAG: DUF2953 domain-containing protein [Clostridia bacterium]|nr:DUF2953 domain-containing protein [Clostridia bacterium]